ncbi:MAG TPA: serine/threonine protein kinase [Cyanobacteria bacterium UBA11149]|nr:serine/threonine protein kinase [Cyanobacteria bacterium UBA11367]HBE59201.1 serine/threonine protein kinase [Cyanobacteria bacterium UBA11366]HBK64476.1 serine/threonine protein kinase [Cyanobacteria bacterium UBA11166]HBR73560.1 serine/threonine protein kinase [Cyanobacteria bacterium UBA11159]HBS69347.1 serine/threonine protein kinase [Cyanobacteria bacterium UBA11153]HBW88551.1 serine/threonine protein kinase [Cyanobacteria bacterium UBA11149]HCA98268.1 serine/threonine protein kinase 
MNTFPDFSNYGYQITREIGNNRAGGRVTYLATEINTQKNVVIKQFQFAQTGANWTEYQAYEQEIAVLRELNHPNIPRYLDSFQTAAGFSMVQEYKNAPSLANSRLWKPQEIKHIAISALEILKYLQNRIPPIIHRDLKPENILVDEGMNLYLVDFGFARMGGGDVAVSSVVKGTLGFMPPEQMFNRQLTVASDIYSLGATLICLLTNTPSTEVGSLMDDEGRINFKQRVSHLSEGLINWLEKMVETNYKQRYPSAEAALEALIPLEIFRPIQTPKWIFPLVGTLIFTLAVTVLGIIKWQDIKKAEINKKEVALQAVTVTLNPKSTQKIDKFTLNTQRVYFSVTLPDLKNQTYQGTCQMLDRESTLVAMGESTLKASANGLKAWCWYNFDKNVDKPGEWMFKFSVDGKNVAEKKLSVVDK